MPELPSVRRLAPPLLLVVLVLAFHARLLPVWTTATVGSDGMAHVDASLHLWQYGWLSNVLERGGSLFTSDGLTYPANVDLLGLWEGHLDLLVAAPLVTWAGPYAAANTASLVHLAILALGAYALCRALSGQAAAGAVAVSLYILSPVFGHEFGEGRIEAGCLGFVALALLWGGRWFDGGRVRHLLGSLSAVALALSGYLHSGPMLALLVPGLAAACLLAGRRTADGGPAPWTRLGAFVPRGVLISVGLAGIAAVALAFAGHHVSSQGLSAFSTSLFRDPAFRGWFDQSRGNGLPLRDLFLPMPLARQAGSGLVLPLLALLSLAAPRRLARTLPWWIGAAVLHFAALGTVLSLAGEPSSISSPYGYLPFALPYVLRFQWPQRYLLLADLCLAVLAAIGLAAVGDRIARSRWGGTPRLRLLRLAALLLVLGAALLQARPGWPLGAAGPPALPQVVEVIAEDDPVAVLEVQAGGHEAEHASWQLFQYDRIQATLVHRAPMCCLDLPRRQAPLSLDRLVSNTPLMAWLLYGYRMPELESGSGLVPEMWGYTHLVVHGHGCSTTIRSLESLGWVTQAYPEFDPSAEMAVSGTPGGSRARVDQRSCDEVLALLADTYGLPAMREAAGDGMVALWRLPRSPLLLALDPAFLETATPSRHAPPSSVQTVLRPR